MPRIQITPIDEGPGANDGAFAIKVKGAVKCDDLAVKPTDTVADLKKKLQGMSEPPIDPARQCLVLKKKVLRDGTLRDNGVAEGSKLKLHAEHEFYLISTLEEIIAIDASTAELEIYLKFYWKVEGLEEKIRAKEICVKASEGGAEMNEIFDEETRMPKAFAFVRGGLPSAGKGGKDVLFEYSLPVAPDKVFDNERSWADRSNITPPWTAFDCKKGVVSVQLHLHLKVKCPDPDREFCTRCSALLPALPALLVLPCGTRLTPPFSPSQFGSTRSTGASST